MIRECAGLRARGRHEDEALHARRLRGGGKLGRRNVVHAVVHRFGNLRPDMRDAGEMHDGVHPGDERMPVDRLRKVGQRHDVSAGQGVQSPAFARRGAHGVPGLRQRRRQRPSDESRRARHQDAHQRLPRWKVSRTQATSAPPSASVARSTRQSGSIALTSASPASDTLSTNTRTTISGTEKPPSVAR